MELTDGYFNLLLQQIYTWANTPLEWCTDFFHRNICHQYAICSAAIAYRPKNCTETENQALKPVRGEKQTNKSNSENDETSSFQTPFIIFILVINETRPLCPTV